MTQYQKELKARFDIKNLKTMQGLDGLVIGCELYWDNKKIAHFHNDGHGGGAIIHPYPIKNNYEINRAKLKEVDNLISKLPKINSDFGNVLSADIDWVVEEIVEIRLFNKKMKGAILVGVPCKSNIFGEILPKSKYSIITFKGIRSLDKMNPEHLKQHIAQIKKELKEGEIIFNTNLP